MTIHRKSDPGRIKTESTDIQRDTAAKGGPAAGLGDAQNRQVPSPADEDLQTQAAAKSTSNQREDVPGEGGLDEPSHESQTHSRGSNAKGSNH